MNASYFVLVAAALTFATGFFVASIIWGIKWLLMPSEEKVQSENSVHLLHIFSRNDLNKEFVMPTQGNKSMPINYESVNNNELYQYHYGKN